MKPLAMTEDNFNAIVRAADPSATDIKTETRRLVTISGYADGFVNSLDISNESGQFVAKGWFSNAPFEQILTPRMKIGDRAYLKEPTQVLCTNPEDSTNIESCNVAYFWGDKLITYEGISDRRWVDLAEGDSEKLCNRKSGIYSKQGAMFMLKSFARHSVEILDVRVERLRDITDEGAIAEGVQSVTPYLRGEKAYKNYLTGGFTESSPIKSYISEIEMLHSKEVAAANPWLWVYRFRYVTGE